ncbi:MAG: HlyD family efflux transporter periplasmic adaptor subunit [Synechococcus sp.]|nr:HlyD family efflux transporter periplasmic adaptor subunit [Synechococcus sp.]
MSAPLARILRAWPWLLGAAVVLGGVAFWRSRPAPAPAPSPVARPAAPRAVAALGRLEPAGDVRQLAAPMTGFGGAPRITELLVEEGQTVQAGQLLARFDNGPVLAAERRLLETRIANLERRVDIQQRDIARYRTLARQGAFPSGSLDSRETDLLKLVGERNEAQAQLAKVVADLENTELRAPISGTVLRLQARVGERPGEDGILELGASDRMEALLEVYESDIDRVRLGQTVQLSSENGGFDGTLSGRVVRISPQVRQREVLSTDPTGDADARIVEVRVALDPADRARVRDLTGLKVIARFSS